MFLNNCDVTCVDAPPKACV